jgi:hypothetical protein
MSIADSQLAISPEPLDELGLLSIVGLRHRAVQVESAERGWEPIARLLRKTTQAR